MDQLVQALYSRSQRNGAGGSTRQGFEATPANGRYGAPATTCAQQLVRTERVELGQNIGQNARVGDDHRVFPINRPVIERHTPVQGIEHRGKAGLHREKHSRHVPSFHQVLNDNLLRATGHAGAVVGKPPEAKDRFDTILRAEYLG